MGYLRSIVFSFLMILIMITFSSCGGSSGGNSSSTDPPITIKMTDSIDDVAFDFIDLKSGSVKYEDNNITITIEMKNLPDNLTFDHTELDKDYLEYSWVIIFDLDDNGVRSKDDIEVAIMYFKLGDFPEGDNNILTKTQEDIWIVTQDNNSSELVRLNDVKKDGNSFIISLSKNLHKTLSRINSNCKLIVKTSYDSGTETDDDEMKN